MSERGSCRPCGGALLEQPVLSKEMMLGTRDPFEYRECSVCGCVQISEYPEHVERYYPAGYYSLGTPLPAPLGPVRGWLRSRRARHALGRFDPVGRVLGRLRPPPVYYSWLSPSGIGLDGRILEIGCGDGYLLAYLRDEGFRSLHGVDPHARAEARRQPGFEIESELEDVRGEFDFVLLSHSLEHMPNQAAVFRHLRRLSHEATTICIRIPIASRAWKLYGPDWVQLDPPRHFYLHTPRSLESLARSVGLRVRTMTCDSSSFQFWGSELYRRGIELYDSNGRIRTAGAFFTPGQIADWERRASELNETGDGDQAIFHLGLA